MSTSYNRYGVPKTVQHAAHDIAAPHRSEDAAMTGMFGFPDPDDREVWLIKVTPQTPRTGELSIFGLRGDPTVPFRVQIGEITPDEWDDLRARRIPLPPRWSLGTSKKVA